MSTPNVASGLAQELEDTAMREALAANDAGNPDVAEQWLEVAGHAKDAAEVAGRLEG
jgi:hypothetical protein